MKDNRKANDIKEKMKKKKKTDPISSLHDIPREKPWIHDIRRRLFILKQNINREEWWKELIIFFLVPGFDKKIVYFTSFQENRFCEFIKISIHLMFMWFFFTTLLRALYLIPIWIFITSNDIHPQLLWLCYLYFYFTTIYFLPLVLYIFFFFNSYFFEVEPEFEVYQIPFYSQIREWLSFVAGKEMAAARMAKTGIIETGYLNGWDIHIFNDPSAFYNFRCESPYEMAYLFTHLFDIFDLDIYIIRPWFAFPILAQFIFLFYAFVIMSKFFRLRAWEFAIILFLIWLCWTVFFILMVTNF